MIWHFFRNSICFMCFRFGLEILRQVYKKCFLKYGTVSILLDLLSPKNLGLPLIRVEKKFLQNWAYRVWNKKFLQKNWIFRDLENCAKIGFLRKNLWELLDARVLHIFEISAKFRFFWYPLHPILKNFLKNSYKGRCCFFWS